MRKPFTLLFISFLLLLNLITSDSKAITILRGHVAIKVIHELVRNGGFEIVGTGIFPEVSDDDGLFEGWYEIEGAGTLIRTIAAGEFHSGSAALKMTTGIAAPNTHVYDAFVVAPGGTYRYEIWVRSEAVGGVEGRWCIYDWINWAYITFPAGLHGTGVTGSTWTLITGTFIAPAGCTLAGVYLYCPVTIGKIVWFDDVSVKQVVE